MRVRVASLLPGITQLVDELGGASCVVACTHECRLHDAGAKARARTRTSTATVVTEAKLPTGDDDDNDGGRLTDGDTEISAGWAAVSCGGGGGGGGGMPSLQDKACAYYRVDIALLRRAAPDVLLTVLPTARTPLDADMDEVVDALKTAIPTLRSVHHIDASSSQEITANTRTVAAALGLRHAADSVLASAAIRRDLLLTLTLGLHIAGGTPAARRSVAVVQWGEPCWLAGGYMPEAIELAGGVSPHMRPGAPSACCAPGALAGHDIVIFAVCALPLRRAVVVARTFVERHRPLFDRPSTRIVAFDASRNFNFATPAVFADTAELISDIMHGRRDDKLWVQLPHTRARARVPLAT